MLRHGGVQLVVKQLAHTGDSSPVTNSTWIHAPRAPDTNFIDVETVRMNEVRGVVALWKGELPDRAIDSMPIVVLIARMNFLCFFHHGFLRGGSYCVKSLEMVLSSLFSLPLSFHVIVCTRTSNRLCGFAVGASRRYAYVIQSISLLRIMAEESNRNHRSTGTRFHDVKAESELRTCLLRVSLREVHSLASLLSSLCLFLSRSLLYDFFFSLFATFVSVEGNFHARIPRRSDALEWIIAIFRHLPRLPFARLEESRKIHWKKRLAVNAGEHPATCQLCALWNRRHLGKTRRRSPACNSTTWRLLISLIKI